MGMPTKCECGAIFEWMDGYGRCRTCEISRLSAENADAQAKEAFALGKLEETLKIESELRAWRTKVMAEIKGLSSDDVEHAVDELKANCQCPNYWKDTPALPCPNCIVYDWYYHDTDHRRER